MNVLIKKIFIYIKGKKEKDLTVNTLNMGLTACNVPSAVWRKKALTTD